MIHLVSMQYAHGIGVNLGQFAHQLLQVLLVGLTLGMMRTVVPALSESDFGVPKTSFLLLASFVMAFGVVKGVMNFVAGRLSEQVGRRRVLIMGWWVVVPVPFMVWYAPNWGWVVAATLLLGVHQGLTWSMTQTAKLDLTHTHERGLTLGLNEFAGYVGVAAAGLATAWLAANGGARWAVLVFGVAVIGVGLLLSLAAVRETLPWARVAAVATPRAREFSTAATRSDAAAWVMPSTWVVFAQVSWRDRRMFAVCQAAMVEKFVDALVWVIYPVYLYQQSLSLPEVGAVISVYGLMWGVCQLLSGPLSDRVGRHLLNVWGMALCGLGVALMVCGHGVAWWCGCAALSGLGMALLYPNLAAAIADMAPPLWRGSAIGIYRLWRDLGYALGALGLAVSAQLTQQLESAFWFVAASMAASTFILWWLGEETYVRPPPAPMAR